MWKLTKKFPDFTYWKSVFLDIFCPLLTLHLVALENLVWAHGPEPTRSLKIGFGSKGIQNEKFRFPIFLANRVWANQAKSWKWVMFKTLHCTPQWCVLTNSSPDINRHCSWLDFLKIQVNLVNFLSCTFGRDWEKYSKNGLTYGCLAVFKFEIFS